MSKTIEKKNTSSATKKWHKPSAKKNVNALADAPKASAKSVSKSSTKKSSPKKQKPTVSTTKKPYVKKAKTERKKQPKLRIDRKSVV